MAQHDRARHEAAPTVATPAPARPADVARPPPPLAALQRLAGNQAVAQLVAAPDAPVVMEATPADPAAAPGAPPRAHVPTVTDVDPRARVDTIQRAILLNPVLGRFEISMDLMIEALTDLTPGDGRAIREEYRRRTGWDLRWVVTGQQSLPPTFGMMTEATMGTSLGQLERQRVLNLLGGTAVAPADPERAAATGATVGALAAGAARLLGRDDIADELGEKVAAAATAHVTADQERERTTAEVNRTRADAATIRRHIERKEGEQAIAMIRRPNAERQALASQYLALYRTELYLDLTSRLKGIDVARVAATWIDDHVTADRLALESDLARQRRVDTAASMLESANHGLFGPTTADLATRELGKRQRREARARVEARLAGIAAAGEQDAGGDRASGREHLGKVLDQAGSTPGVTLRSELASQGDRVAQAIAVDDEARELASRLARADVEGTLKHADLEAALRHLRTVARRIVVERVTRQPDLAPFAEQLLIATTASTYDAFRKRFDADDTKRTLDQALGIEALFGITTVEQERNRALLESEGSLPAWRELDLALRRTPKDMARVRTVLGRQDRPAILGIAAEYQANTGRSLHTDLLGTPEQQRLAELLDRDEARQEHLERLVLLGGGRFHSETADEATRLEEERQWLGARCFALKRAVIQNRGAFARARDWVGNIEKSLVDRADTDITDANIAASRALGGSPPDVAAARAALAEMRRAGARLERNLDVYKEATKAAFDEFVDLAVLAVTTIVTLGEGTVVIMAIRATMATVGTKLVLKGNDYSADEFLMDLRSGLGAAAGGKLAEGVLKPVAAKVAGYAARTGLSTGLTGKVAGAAGKAAMWEGEQVLTTTATNVVTGQDLGTGLGLEGQTTALAQHGVTTGVRAARAARRGRTTTEGSADGPTARARGQGEGPSSATDRDPLVTRPDASPTSDVDVDVDVPVRVPMALPDVPDTPRRSRARPISEPAPEATSATADTETPSTTRDEPSTPRRPTAQDATTTTPDERSMAAAPGGPTTGTLTSAEAFRLHATADERAHRIAGAYAPVFDELPHLRTAEQRRARLEQILNQTLQGTGLPHVPLQGAALPPGNASFSPNTFVIQVDLAYLMSPTLTPAQFAHLAGSLAHEARHALQVFRSLRVMAADTTATLYATDANNQPPEHAVRAAEEANAGTRPAEPMDVTSPAFGEAADVFQAFFGEGAATHDAVMTRLRLAADGVVAAQARVDATQPGTPERAIADAEQAAALQESRTAHHDYMAMPYEVDAWRRGLATELATLQRLTARQLRALVHAEGRAAGEVALARSELDRLRKAGMYTPAAEMRLAQAIEAYDRIVLQQAGMRADLHELQERGRPGMVQARLGP
ncbi:MAG: hypothetical protein KF809_07910 [Chloroflexi bacterium]|nr:hypothetical protein [Chloroflexota bacterium]